MHFLLKSCRMDGQFFFVMLTTYFLKKAHNICYQVFMTVKWWYAARLWKCVCFTVSLLSICLVILRLSWLDFALISKQGDFGSFVSCLNILRAAEPLLWLQVQHVWSLKVEWRLAWAQQVGKKTAESSAEGEKGRRQLAGQTDLGRWLLTTS